MSEPQLSVRSAKAKELAHALSARTGLPINRLIEDALEHYDSALRNDTNATPIDAVWRLAADSKEAVPAGETAAHGDLYDEHGLPT